MTNKLDKQIKSILESTEKFIENDELFEAQKQVLVSQIKQSILKAIMDEGKELKTEKYKELWTLDYHCRWCGIEKGKEHLGACDFLIEANKNATINKFESVIKEVLSK